MEFIEEIGTVIDPLDTVYVLCESVVGPETLFGKTVVVTANMIDNSALVGAFRQGAMIFYREGMRVEATNSNEDDFKYNLVVIRAEQREALVVWRPPAFCKVTGLST